MKKMNDIVSTKLSRSVWVWQQQAINSDTDIL